VNQMKANNNVVLELGNCPLSLKAVEKVVQSFLIEFGYDYTVYSAYQFEVKINNATSAADKFQTLENQIKKELTRLSQLYLDIRIINGVE